MEKEEESKERLQRDSAKIVTTIIKHMENYFADNNFPRLEILMALENIKFSGYLQLIKDNEKFEKALKKPYTVDYIG